MTMNKILIILLLFGLGCSSLKIKDGKTAFDYHKYNKAIGLLKDEFQSSSRSEIRGEKAYYIAESYLKLNNYIKANEWFATSEQLGYGPKAISGLAKTYKNLEKYDKAISYYSKLENIMPGDPNIKREKLICKEVLKWKTDVIDQYSVRKLMQNSMYSDYSPAFYESDWLIFTSDNESATGSGRYDWTGNKMSDLFIVDKYGNSDVRKFDSYINSVHNDGAATFTKDFNEMYFTRCFNTQNSGDEYCKLMVSYRAEGIWTEPIVLPFVKENINYGQPALIEDDQVLIFSSTSEDQSTGYDLFYTERLDNTWTDPYSMPESINSPGDEYFPTSDGDTLYFSSDYLIGMGGLDIFKTYLKADGSWAVPENMKSPINSGADDFGLILDRNGRPISGVEMQGYLTSTRSYEGHEDIYYLEKYKVISSDEIPIVADTKIENRNISLYLAGKVQEYVFTIDGDPNSGIKSKSSIPNPYIKVNDDASNVLDINSNDKGLFIGTLEYGKTYTILVKKQGYLNSTIEVNTNDYIISENEDSYTINQDIILERIYIGQEIVLDNIYYDFNESFIREDAKPTLDKLARKLMDNPQIDIELSSHTDCRGELDYNQELSQARAQAAVDYLISKGIDGTKLSAQGYGETSPKNNCVCDSCSEDQHQKNRRTSFKIL